MQSSVYYEKHVKWLYLCYFSTGNKLKAGGTQWRESTAICDRRGTLWRETTGRRMWYIMAGNNLKTDAAHYGGKKYGSCADVLQEYIYIF